MSESTLFDELCEADTQGKRLGLDKRSTFVPYDAETLRLWEEHGIPADLSTVEQACDLLMRLWRHHQEFMAAVTPILDGKEAA